MKKLMTLLGVSTMLLFPLLIAAQEEGRLDDKIDELTYKWDLEADKLSSYNGLISLCEDKAYRTEIFDLLKQIHHYDTVLYNVLLGLAEKKHHDKEVDKTIKDIKKFEEEYDLHAFIEFMREECKAMQEIEKKADDTRNEVGLTSYSSQTYMLETELYKYVMHVTAKVDKIRKHVHHLSHKKH